MKFIIPICLALPLAGCLTDGTLPSSTLQPICEALIGPIRYNTYSKESKRYAAAVLAMDLKTRNQVGQRLHCPQYR
jgi:hypothetical protein